jgi:hypothetical protein
MVTWIQGRFSLSTSSAFTDTGVPGGVCRIAFSRRFEKTWDFPIWRGRR